MTVKCEVSLNDFELRINSLKIGRSKDDFILIKIRDEFATPRNGLIYNSGKLLINTNSAKMNATLRFNPQSNYELCTVNQHTENKAEYMITPGMSFCIIYLLLTHS